MFALRLFACSLLIVACDTPAAPVEDAGTDGGPPGYDAGPITRIPESEAAANRASCTYERGAMPWQTIGAEHPIGDEIPIDHIFVLMQENRSFDHYFGTMPGVEGIPAGATNPDADGAPVSTFHTSEYCIEDVAHGWRASHVQYNDGAVDGFVTTNDPEGGRALGYLDESDLPFYWDLARTFAMSDHHHCSVLGPTWPNRYYLLSGTSFGLVSNDPTTDEILPDEGEYVIMQELDRAGVSWGIYYQAVPFAWGGYPQYALRPRQRAHTKLFDELWNDLEAGTLPSVVFLDPSWSATDSVDANDEHPPANPQRGQAYVREIVTRIMASDVWARSAIIVTYDEHGGFFDHVAPPEACHPGDRSPDSSVSGDFDRLGFRVPLMVVSPYSRPGYVSDRVTDATSVLRFVQTRFLLPALSGRDANAWPLLDMFDFESAPALLDPPELAEAPVDEAQVAACRAAFD
jgi:phospholipase C